jgi:hypothetical protein
MNGPRVFVSSTYYDLRQVRKDLGGFLASVGCTPVLSETSTFPVMPGRGTVDNCISNVDNSDILVLIVGGRYGTMVDSNKAVTNLEYDTAKMRGIPIYTFVEKSVMAILPVWRKNKDGDYKEVCDSPKPFEFVDRLVKPDAWVFQFASAEDIIEVLRTQFGFLFRECLGYWRGLRSANVPFSLASIGGEALRILIDKPTMWEFKFFRALVARELEAASGLRRDLQYSFVLERKSLDVLNFTKWCTQKLEEAKALGTCASAIANTAFKDAMQPAGVPADPEALAYCAHRIGAAYCKSLQWKLEFASLEVDSRLSRLRTVMAEGLDLVTKELESVLPKFDAAIKAGEEHIAKNTREVLKVDINLDFKIRDGWVDEIGSECERLAANPF